MEKLVFATHNKNKLAEFRTLLAPLGYRVLGADDVNLPDIEETGTTFHENSMQKAMAAAKATGMMALADDSGLCVHALNNEPGLYSARYAVANGGFPKVFDVLFERLKDTTDWSAHFECCLCLVKEDKPLFFEGQVQGHLTCDVDDSCGAFGYDPVFVPDGYDKTFGGMDSTVKNKISHRARALEKLMAYLKG